ncbi:MAG TPA: chlorite dismutase family protein [Thermodesulfobacteriota bacterium]|nr:chlorite dismutase family protein [Thermodesulfobacteriota bacterium]
MKKMSLDIERTGLDISEKGRAKDGTELSSDRRLLMQLLAFGNCHNPRKLVDELKKSKMDFALYADINDPYGIGLLAVNEDPDFFVGGLREFLNGSAFTELTPKPEYTMLGRTYSFGYEPDLERTLIHGPRERVLDPELKWAIWYPLRRNKLFETLSSEEQRSVLGEHGKLGFKFGDAGYGKDIRLACHGLDKNDNDFVIGVLGKKLYPLSILIQSMRKTKQTSMYLESLGPFFIGKVLWQAKA